MMEAKDTAMDDSAIMAARKASYSDRGYPITDVCRYVTDEDRWIAKYQAQISFKAGQDSVFDSMPENLSPLLGAAHRSGIREVVKWIEEHSDTEATYTDDLHITRSWLELPISAWQAFKKERGIK